MSKLYVYFKDEGAIHRGKIVGENGDQVIVEYQVRRSRSLYEGINGIPSYTTKHIELSRSQIFTEVASVL